MAIATKDIQDKAAHRIPQTPGLPLIGSIPNVLRQQIDFLTQAQEQQGEHPVGSLGVLAGLEHVDRIEEASSAKPEVGRGKKPDEVLHGACLGEGRMKLLAT